MFSLVHWPPKNSSNFYKTKKYGVLLIYPSDTFRHHTLSKNAVTPSRTIESQYHAQDCPWESSVLSYRDNVLINPVLSLYDKLYD